MAGLNRQEKVTFWKGFQVKLISFFKQTGEWLLRPASEQPHRSINYIWLAGVYLLGLLLWGQFLNWGRIPFDFHDWAEISAPRLAFVQDAVRSGQLPLHMPDGSALRNVTDRFMAIPDVMLSPQVLLLAVMDIGSFVLVNTWLLYSLGFLGLLWFWRKYELSPLVFTALSLLFNFNGSLLSHFSVGHVNYTGYLLFPVLIALLIQMLEGVNNWRWITKFSFLMFFILLQGSFHQFIWGLMLTGLVGLFYWKYFLQVLKALVFTCLLSSVRLLPPALLLGVFDKEFLSGYPTLLDVFTALIVTRGPQDAFLHKSILTSLGWWEFDLYIGLIGMAVVLVFGLVFWLRNLKTTRQYLELFLPVVVLFTLSIGRLYRLVMLLPIPLLNGERVSARFMSLVFVVLLLIGVINLNQWLKERRIYSWAGWASSGLLLVMISDLWQNLKLWRVNVAYEAFPKTPVDLAIKVVSNHSDPTYSTFLIIGSVVSVITLVSLLLAPRMMQFNKEQNTHDS
ncbi:MAG: hypothetical protein AB9891_04910 [Anaerolineaceae bacterium]